MADPITFGQPTVPPQKFASKTWSDLPQGVRTAFVVVGSGVALFSAWKLYKFLEKRAQEARGRQVVKETKDTLKDLEKSGIKPSYSDSQYLSWAQNIQVQMDGCGTGSDKLYGIFSNMKNDADINKLIVAYGTRTVDKCGLGTGDYSGDLTSTLAYKFSGVEGAMNPYVLTNINAYFTKRGMKFRF